MKAIAASESGVFGKLLRLVAPTGYCKLARATGGASYELNIILPHEQCENPYVDKSSEF